MAMLPFLFACCGLRHRPHDPPTERTPLIPHADDTPSPQPRLIDHHKLKARLGSVVRSKEGKMVNVNAQFPFDPSAPPSRAPSPSPSTAEDPPPVLNVRLVRSARGRPLRTPQHLPNSDAPPYPEDFDIHDAGAVARSWAD